MAVQVYRGYELQAVQTGQRWEVSIYQDNGQGARPLPRSAWPRRIGMESALQEARRVIDHLLRHGDTVALR